MNLKASFANTFILFLIYLVRESYCQCHSSCSSCITDNDENACTICAVSNQVIKSTVQGQCVDLVTACSANEAFILTSSDKHLGSCETSAQCRTFDYSGNDHGFLLITTADNHCKNCIISSQAILQVNTDSTYGQCQELSSICQSASAFVLKSATEHLGTCEQSSKCQKFDYTSNQGFSTLESAETKCTECKSGNGILKADYSSTHGSCSVLETICSSTANSAFVLSQSNTNNYLGTCETSSKCSKFDYSTGLGFASLTLSEDSCKKCLSAAQGILKGSQSITSGSCANLETICSAVSNSAFILSSSTEHLGTCIESSSCETFDYSNDQGFSSQSNAELKCTKCLSNKGILKLEVSSTFGACNDLSSICSATANSAFIFASSTVFLGTCEVSTICNKFDYTGNQKFTTIAQAETKCKKCIVTSQGILKSSQDSTSGSCTDLSTICQSSSDSAFILSSPSEHLGTCVLSTQCQVFDYTNNQGFESTNLADQKCKKCKQATQGILKVEASSTSGQCTDLTTICQASANAAFILAQSSEHLGICEVSSLCSQFDYSTDQGFDSLTNAQNKCTQCQSSKGILKSGLSTYGSCVDLDSICSGTANSAFVLSSGSDYLGTCEVSSICISFVYHEGKGFINKDQADASCKKCQSSSQGILISQILSDRGSCSDLATICQATANAAFILLKSTEHLGQCEASSECSVYDYLVDQGFNSLILAQAKCKKCIITSKGILKSDQGSTSGSCTDLSTICDSTANSAFILASSQNQEHLGSCEVSSACILFDYSADQGFASLTQAETKCKKCSAQTKGILKISSQSTSGSCTDLSSICASTANSAFILSSAQNHLGTCEVSQTCSTFDYTSDQGFALLTDAQLKCTKCLTNKGILKAEPSSTNGQCADLSSICSATANSAFILSSNQEFLGTCETSSLCQTFDYSSGAGFTTLVLAEASCKRCISQSQGILTTSTSGACSDLATICQAKDNSAFILSSDHLGSCEISTSCSTFDYSSDQGFSDLSVAETRCTKCLIQTQGILKAQASSKHGSCTNLATICQATTNSAFVLSQSTEHLGSCEVSIECSLFDYLADQGFNSLALAEAKCKKCIAQTKGILKIVGSSTSGSCSDLSTICGSTANSAFILTSSSEHVGSCEVSTKCSKFDYSTDQGFTTLILAENKCTTCLAQTQGVLKSSSSGECQDLATICSSNFAFIISKSGEHLGLCEESQVCATFDYSQDQGFNTKALAEAKCKKCIEASKGILKIAADSTSGACSALTEICQATANSAFILASSSEHLGSCEVSTLCSLFDYSADQGFNSLTLAENKCKTCLQASKGILKAGSSTSGSCSDLASICQATANTAFIISTAGEHLGTCVGSSDCAVFDYSSNQGFTEILAADAKCKQCIASDKGILKNAADSTSGSCSQVSTICSQTANSAFVLASDSHLGTCEASTECSLFDYSSSSQGYQSLANAETHCKKCLAATKAILKASPSSSSGACSELSIICQAVQNSAFILSNSPEHLGTCEISEKCSVFDYTSDQGFTALVEAEKKCTQCTANKGILKAEASSTNGACADVSSICSEQAFLLVSSFLGNCESSQECSLFDYSATGTGFASLAAAEASCKKCKVKSKSILQSGSSGTCAELSTICASTKAFVLASSAEHLGTCETSSQCTVFDYSEDQGFVSLSAAEGKCKQCLSGKGILKNDVASKYGTCTDLASICSGTANSAFLLASTESGEHLGTCEVSSKCTNFDYTSDQQGFASLVVAETKCTKCAAGKGILSGSTHGSCEDLASICSATANSAFILTAQDQSHLGSCEVSSQCSTFEYSSQGYATIQEAEAKCKVCIDSSKGILKSNSESTSGSCSELVTICSSVENSAFIISKSGEDLGTCQISQICMAFEYSSDKGFASLNDAQAKCNKCLGSRGVLKSESNTQSGSCTELSSICSGTANSAFVLATANNHLGTCEVSTECSSFDYLENQGFSTLQIADSKCKKCIDNIKAIVQVSDASTSGSCTALSEICSQGLVFIRDTSQIDNHLGKCQQSLICSIFDYTNDRGFTDTAAGEQKCKKCIDENKAIKASDSGSCTLLTEICSSGEAFIRSNADNHLGSCQSSMICSSFDYSNDRGFQDVATSETKCKTCQADGKAINSLVSGSCEDLASICTTEGQFFQRIEGNTDHLGSCGTSLVCALFDYSNDKGFISADSADTKCTKCLQDGKAINSATAGLCADLSTICQDQVFVRSVPDGNHLGSCITSTVCLKFDYTNDRGFADAAAGEAKCLKCAIQGEVVNSLTASSCVSLATLCTNSGEFFLRVGEESHLGSCSTSVVCSLFDYSVDDRGFMSKEQAEVKCTKCLEEGKVIKSEESGACTSLTTVCAESQVYVRKTPGQTSDHLGQCQASQVCTLFDYSSDALGFTDLANGEAKCTKCQKEGFAILPEANLRYGTCTSLNSLCGSAEAFIRDSTDNHLGSCKTSSVCSIFDYSKERGFTDVVTAETQCTKCKEDGKAIKSTSQGSCMALDVICESGSTFVRLASSLDDSSHLGECMSSLICEKFDYSTDRGFSDVTTGESKCQKCLQDGYVINKDKETATSGSCAATSSVCAEGFVFIRDSVGFSGNTNHLGSCEASTVCAIPDYSADRGFASSAAAEAKCKKCMESGKVIKSSDHGTCEAVATVCIGTHEVFLRLDVSNHLGSCTASSLCSKFDYSETLEGFSSITLAESHCTTCVSTESAILKTSENSKSGNCAALSTICESEAFIRASNSDSLGTCVASLICSNFDYKSSDYGFASITDAEAKCKKCKSSKQGILRQTENTISGTCTDLSSICSTKEHSAFVRSTDLGTCETSTKCSKFDYSQDQGFLSLEDAEAKCILCVASTEVILSSTSGSCALVITVCSATPNSAFVRSSQASDHLGQCKASSICASFDYSNAQGFESLEAAEKKCFTCIDPDKAILENAGTCGHTATLCTESKSYFSLPDSTTNHVGQCAASMICLTFDYTASARGFSSLETAESQCITCEAGYVILGQAPGKCVNVSTICQINESFIYVDGSSHVGTCQSSQFCATFDYSSKKGFSDLDSAEVNCLNCQINKVFEDVTKQQGKCITSTCTSPCSACHNTQSFCDGCIVGKLLTENNCDTEAQCESPCATCHNTNTLCDSCIVGRLLHDNACSAETDCQSPCATCHDLNSKCDSCIVGRKLVENNCDQPSCTVEHCELCEETKCKICQIGFFIKEELCLPCDSSCLTCSEATNFNCTSCTEPKFLTNRKACREPCEASSFFNFQQEDCQFCGQELDNCVRCGMDNNTFETRCTECRDLYYVEQQSIGLCKLNCQQAGLSFCSQCWEEAGQTKFSCIQCEDPLLYMLKYDATCVQIKECTVEKTFFNPNEDSCQDCPANCAKCLWSDLQGSAQCSLCSEGYSLQEDGSCIPGQKACPDGFFLNQICEKCSDNCLMCTSGSLCDECMPGFQIQEEGDVPLKKICFLQSIESECQLGQYAKTSISNQIECYDCSEGCARCLYNETLDIEQCIQCIDKEYWFFSIPQLKCISKQCPEGSVFNVNFGCEQCPFMCKQCSRTISGELECKACLLPEYVLELPGRCVFQASQCGELQGAFANQCVDCPKNCIKCNNTATSALSIQCETCEEGFKVVEGYCFGSECAAKQYLSIVKSVEQPSKITLECTSCPPGCLQCQFNSPKQRIECSGDCESSNFSFNIELNVCQPNASDALTCEQAQTIAYSANRGFSCTACPSGCKQCTWKNDQFICTECVDKFILSTTDQLCQPDKTAIIPKSCEIGSTFDYQTGDCRACPEGCLKCTQQFTSASSPTYPCTQCNNITKYRLDENNKCLLRCKNTEMAIDDGKAQVCLACSKNCKSCQMNEKELCYECSTGYLLKQGTCSIATQCSYDQTPFFEEDDTQPFTINQICVSCPSGCLNCSATDPYDLLSPVTCKGCGTGYTKDTSTQTCYSDKQNQNTCGSSEYFQPSSTNSGECKNCTEGCTSCELIGSGELSCYTCAANYYLNDQNKCIQLPTCTKTSQAFFKDEFQVVSCFDCPAECAKCSLKDLSNKDTLICSECISVDYQLKQNACLKTYNNEEKPTCDKENYYPILIESTFTQCYECPEGCAKCQLSDFKNKDSKLECSSCLKNYKLSSSNTTCEDLCSGGSEYFDAIKNECLPCHYACQVCTKAGNVQGSCQECVEGFSFSSQKICVQVEQPEPDCGLDAVYSATKAACQCVDSKRLFNTTMKTCQSLEEFLKLTNCSNGQYFDVTAQQCLQCRSKDGKNRCLACRSGATSDCLLCISGFYLNNEKASCLPCPANCITCSSDTQCTQCEGGFFRYGDVAVKCVKECPAGTLPYIPSLYYLNSQLFSEKDLQQKQTAEIQEELPEVGTATKIYAIAIGPEGKPIFYESSLPWTTNAQKQLIYNRKKVEVECIPCQFNCSKCLSNQLYIIDKSQCYNDEFCPEGYYRETGSSNCQLQPVDDSKLLIKKVVVTSLDSLTGAQSTSNDLYVEAITNMDKIENTTFYYEWQLVNIENDLAEIKKSNPQSTLNHAALDQAVFTKYQNSFLTNTNLASPVLYVPQTNLFKNLIYSVQVTIIAKQETKTYAPAKSPVIKFNVKSIQKERSFEDLGVSAEMLSVSPKEGISGVTQFKASINVCASKLIQAQKPNDAEQWKYQIEVGDDAIPIVSRKCNFQASFMVPGDKSVDRTYLLRFTIQKGEILYTVNRKFIAKKNTNYNIFETEIFKALLQEAAPLSLQELTQAAAMIKEYIETARSIKLCESKNSYLSSQDFDSIGACNQSITVQQCCGNGQCITSNVTQYQCQCSSSFTGTFCDIPKSTMNEIVIYATPLSARLVTIQLDSSNINTVVAAILLLAKAEINKATILSSLADKLSEASKFVTDSKTLKSLLSTLDQLRQALKTESSQLSEAQIQQQQLKNQQALDSAIQSSVKGVISKSNPTSTIDAGGMKGKNSFVDINKISESAKSSIQSGSSSTKGKRVLQSSSQSDSVVSYSISKKAFVKSSMPTLSAILQSKGQLSGAKGGALLNSQVLDLSVLDASTGNKVEITNIGGICPVKFTIRAKANSKSNITCLFFDTQAFEFKSDGCAAQEIQAVSTAADNQLFDVTCCCNHMTKFATSSFPALNQTTLNTEQVSGGIDEPDSEIPTWAIIIIIVVPLAIILIIVLIHQWHKKKKENQQIEQRKKDFEKQKKEEAEKAKNINLDFSIVGKNDPGENNKQQHTQQQQDKINQQKDEINDIQIEVQNEHNSQK